MPVLSFAFSKAFGHRTFSHSILFLVAIAALLKYLTVHPDLIVGVLAGMSSHYLLDALTKRGIKLFYPFRLNFGLPIFKTGGAGEKIVAVVLIAISLYLVVFSVADLKDSIQYLISLVVLFIWG